MSFVPAEDRDVWLRMGMGIKSELGEAGHEIWDAWSRRADSYEPAASRAAWKSFKPTGGVTSASVYYEARKHGWHDIRNPSSRPRSELDRQSQRFQSAIDDDRMTSECARAALTARNLWSSAAPAESDHPYLLLKQVRAVATLREIATGAAVEIMGYQPRSRGETLSGRLLVVPIWRDDHLNSAELIDAAGRKTALRGRGSKTGGYWLDRPWPEAPTIPMTVMLGEGVATVLSAVQVTHYYGVAALSAGNLLTVARSIRARFPTAEIIVLADLVKATGEPLPRALTAASAIGAKVAIPRFGNSREQSATDFNDLACTKGAEAVARDITDAGEPAEAVSVTPDVSPGGTEVELLRASDIEPRPVAWLWKGYIASGKLMILAGAPGTGKTTIATSFAAVVSIGGIWPSGERSPVGDVVIWSGEDDPTDTLVPRLQAAGADLSRIHFISTVRQGGEKRPFDPARDIDALRRAVAGHPELRLIIIDPIVSAVAGDSHRNAEVRRALQPMVDLAAERDCALLGITHLSKGTGGRDPVERLTGSLAFGALPRVVLIAARRQQSDDGTRSRMLVRAKSNNGPDGDGFEYELVQCPLADYPEIEASRVDWGAAISGSASDLLASAEASPNEGGAIAEAKVFLTDLLAKGPVEASTVKAKAAEAGHSRATLRRAQGALGIKPRKAGMDAGWMWELPRTCSAVGEDAQHEEMSTFAEQ